MSNWLQGPIGRVAATLFLQGGVQAASLVTGFLIIRLLPADQYALYTIVTAALGSLAVISDLGVSQGVLVQGGKVWRDPKALGGVYASGLSLRKLICVPALALAVPMTSWLLHRQGAGPVESVLIACSLLPAFLAAVSSQLLEVLLKLGDRQLPLQIAQVSIAMLRLVGTLVAALLFPWAVVPMLWTGLTQIGMTIWSRRLTLPIAILDEPPDPVARKAISTQGKATGARRYLLRAVRAAWRMAHLAGRQHHLGLRRLAHLADLTMLFNVIIAAVGMLALPAFARLGASPRAQVMRTFGQYQIVLLAASASVCVLALVWPEGFLLLLGPQYGSLRREVGLAMLGGALGMLSGITYALSAARMIVISPWASIPLSVAVQAGCVAVLPVSQPAGVLWISIVYNLIFYVIHTLYFLRKASAGTR